jgi:hypothetical protein
MRVKKGRATNNFQTIRKGLFRIFGCFSWSPCARFGVDSKNELTGKSNKQSWKLIGLFEVEYQRRALGDGRETFSLFRQPVLHLASDDRVY